MSDKDSVRVLEMEELSPKPGVFHCVADLDASVELTLLF
jgi:hypothetical protein